MRNLYWLVIFLLALSTSGFAQDTESPDSLIMGNLDGTPVVTGIGQQVAVPLWVKFDEALTAIIVVLASDDRFIISRDGGNILWPHSDLNIIDYCGPFEDSPVAGYTSQGLVFGAETSIDPFPESTYTWSCLGELIMTTTSDTAARGQIVSMLDGYCPYNVGGTVFVAPGEKAPLIPAITVGNLQLSTLTAGDINGSGDVNGLDIVYLINFFKGMGPIPDPRILGDINGDCFVTGSDIIYLVNYLKGSNRKPVIGNCH